MKTNKNQFEEYNELRNSKEVNDTIMIFAFAVLIFLAGFMSCFIFIGG